MRRTSVYKKKKYTLALTHSLPLKHLRYIINTILDYIDEGTISDTISF